MHYKKQPAIDPRIATGQGITKTGQPLSYNRAPALDLAPWIARLYVTKVDLPADYTLSCGLFNDTPVLRVQLAGAWTAQTANGLQSLSKAAVVFGPQTCRMPITVTNSFISLGAAIRPGALTALSALGIATLVDRMLLTDEIGTPSDQIVALFEPDQSPEEWLCTLEDFLRRRIAARGGHMPNPVSAQFEQITLREPGISVGDAAEQCGVDRRQLERIVRRDFGMAPKQALRRARALDMASHLRGVADSEEGEEIALRYYDESHLIHEFTELFGMSPRQFVERPQPILTLALESRQARRLEALDRIAPGQIRPWE